MAKSKKQKRRERREREEISLAHSHQHIERDRPPVPKASELSGEVAKPGLTGVRQAWSPESAVAGLTPDRLAAIIRQCDQGDMDALLTLAEEMEERDPHYASVLQTRKLAVLGLERQLAWATGDEDDPRADEIQEACGKLIDAPEFEDLLAGLLDGIAKPYAVVETLWNTRVRPWRPLCYEWRDPRWFQYDRETARELRLKEAGHPDGKPLPAYTFSIHSSGRKSGIGARGGLARLVAFSFVCKLYGLKDWLAYAEIFGIPLRLGKYGAEASPEDVDVLKRAVFGLGSDAAAVIPQSMLIEFPTAGGGATGADLFERLVKWIDSQVSKAVLGQTMTTDDGSSRAQATVHNEVRLDLVKADARGIGATVTRDLLSAFVFFAYGPDAPVPKLVLVVEEPEDVKALSEALGPLIDRGLKVKQTEIRKKFRLSEPAESDEILTPAGGPGAAAAEGSITEQALARMLSLARRQETDIAGPIAAAMDGWERTFGREVGLVADLVAGADSFEAMQAGLRQMAADLSARPAARSLALAMFQAGAVARDKPPAES